MEWGANPSLFHFDLLGCGCILMCLNVGLGGHALLHEVFAPTPSMHSRRGARGVYKVEDSATYISSGGYMAVYVFVSRAQASDGA